MRLYFFVVLLFLAIVYFAMPWDALNATTERLQKEKQQIEQIMRENKG